MVAGFRQSSPEPVERETGSKPLSSLSVCFVPFGESNPYQRKLVDGLRAIGIRVSTRKAISGLFWDAVRGREMACIVHLHWLPFFRFNRLAPIFLAFAFRVLLLRILGKRIVWTVHNLYHHEARHRRIDRLLVRLVSACVSQIIVHSAAAARSFAKEFGGTGVNKVVVVPHGHYIDCYEDSITQREARLQLDLDTNDTVMLFFGNIRPYKGVEHLIDAFRSLPGKHLRLIIAGKPLDESLARDLQGRITGDSRIRLRAKFIPDCEVQVYMNASDFVVLPYQDILSSGAMVLAMSFGKACVAPSLECLADVVGSDGAFLYDGKRPDGLRQALDRAAQDRSALAEMGLRNRVRASKWGWDYVARETAAAYARAMGCG